MYKNKIEVINILRKEPILFDKFCEIVYNISQNCLNKNKIRGNSDESDRHCEKSGIMLYNYHSPTKPHKQRVCR